jgi:hypothetical protein
MEWNGGTEIGTGTAKRDGARNDAIDEGTVEKLRGERRYTDLTS